MNSNYKVNTYEKDGMTVFHFPFDSIDHLLNYTDNAKTNLQVFNLLPASKTLRVNFTKTWTYGQAAKLCRYGFEEGYNNFLEMQNELTTHMPTVAYRRCVESDVVGFAPNIGNYLRGNPKTMNRLVPEEENKFVTIYYNCAYPFSTTNQQLIHKGVVLMELVELLERIGYGVDLQFFELSRCSGANEIIYFSINIKPSGESLNKKVCYFPICHLAFLRRIMFRVLESMEGINPRWANGYGIPLSYDQVRKFFGIDGTSNILFNTPQDLGIKGLNFMADVDSILKNININDYLVSRASTQIVMPEDNKLRVFRQ